MPFKSVLRALGALAGFAHGWRLQGPHLPHGIRRRPHPEPPSPETWADEYGTVERPDGGRLAWTATGTGGPVFLMVHGVTLGGHLWRRQVADLSRDCLVVTVDQRGHGVSDPWDGPHGISHLGADIAAVIESLGLEDVVVVGHSLGGIATAQFLVDHPELRDERVAGAVFLSSTATARLASALAGPVAALVRPVETVGLAVIPRMVPAVVEAAVAPARRGALVTRLAYGAGVREDDLRYTHAQVSGVRGDTLRRVFGSLGSFHLLDRLADVPTPALVMCGDRDLITPRFLSRRLHAALADSTYVEVRGGGHMLMHETPEYVVDNLRCFAESVLPDVWRTRPAIAAAG
ncbi:MAG: alpha/beta hydrolase [Acidimicrobiia bacterium]|nr:alpha/beta hydrolase [Acidimicrobiia bacterium]